MGMYVRGSEVWALVHRSCCIIHVDLMNGREEQGTHAVPLVSRKEVEKATLFFLRYSSSINNSPSIPFGDSSQKRTEHATFEYSENEFNFITH
jgi:hypothetical protein